MLCSPARLRSPGSCGHETWSSGQRCRARDRLQQRNACVIQRATGVVISTREHAPAPRSNSKRTLSGGSARSSPVASCSSCVASAVARKRAAQRAPQCESRAKARQRIAPRRSAATPALVPACAFAASLSALDPASAARMGCAAEFRHTAALNAAGSSSASSSHVLLPTGLCQRALGSCPASSLATIVFGRSVSSIEAFRQMARRVAEPSSDIGCAGLSAPRAGVAYCRCGPTGTRRVQQRRPKHARASALHGYAERTARPAVARRAPPDTARAAAVGPPVAAPLFPKAGPYAHGPRLAEGR